MAVEPCEDDAVPDIYWDWPPPRVNGTALPIAMFAPEEDHSAESDPFEPGCTAGDQAPEAKPLPEPDDSSLDLAGWLARALCTERAALGAELERRHRAIVAALDGRLQPLGEKSSVLSAAGKARDHLARTNGATTVVAGAYSPAPVWAGGETSCEGTIVSGNERSRAGTGSASFASSVTEAVSSHSPSHHSLPGFENGHEREAPAHLSRRRRLQLIIADTVHSVRFEMLFAFLIVMNTAAMALEVQYDGVEVDYRVGFSQRGGRAEQEWPGAMLAFDIADTFFGTCFTVEVTLKLVGLGRAFCRDAWNLFDFVIVGMWLLYRTALGGMNLMTLRICRLAKLMRLLRLMRWIQMFDSLHVMIASLKAGMGVLLWSSVFLFMIMLLCTMVLNNILRGFMLNPKHSVEDRQLVFQYYGSFSRGMVTMFEITLGNWVPVCRTLMEEISEWYGLFFLSYRCVVGFGVIKVITGVFLHETFKCASTDDDLMIMQRQRATQGHARKMQRLFHAADKDGNGVISFEDFHEVMEDPQVQTWLHAMELSVEDVEHLFCMLVQEPGHERLTLGDLIKGTAKLKGHARSLDLITLLQDFKTFKADVEGMRAELKAHLVSPGNPSSDPLSGTSSPQQSLQPSPRRSLSLPPQGSQAMRSQSLKGDEPMSLPAKAKAKAKGKSLPFGKKATPRGGPSKDRPSSPSMRKEL